MRTPLNSLRAFEVAVRKGSLAAAALELCVTPGAVSRQIRNLEVELDVALLVRDGRGMRLTNAGQRLHEELQIAFSQIAETVEDLGKRRSRDRLSIFCPPMFALAWLIPRIDRFGLQSEVSIEDKWTCADTHPPSADLIIDYGRHTPAEGFVIEALTEEEIFPVCNPDLGQRIAEQGGSLSEVTLLHRKGIPETAHWPGWKGFAAAAKLDRSFDFTQGLHLSTALILEAARNGKGLLLTSNTVAHDDLTAGRLVRPIAESMGNGCGYWLQVPKSRLGQSGVAAFRAWLQEEIASCFSAPSLPETGMRREMERAAPSG